MSDPSGAGHEGGDGGDRGLRFRDLPAPPETLPPAASFRARDGSALPFRSYRAASSRRHLILLHGSGSDGRYLGRLAAALAAADAACVHVPDLRGHGAQPARRGDVDDEGQLVRDVADLAAHLRAEAPGSPLFLGGHSSGGGLALRAAGSSEGPEAEGLLLLAPFLHHALPTTRRGGGGWARPRVARIVALRLLNACGVHAFDDRVVITFAMPEAVRDGRETLAYTHRMNAALHPRDFRADLKAVAAAGRRILLLVGAEDEAFVASAYRPEVARHAPAAEVEVLEGASHLGLVGDPRVAARAAAWLESAPPRGAAAPDPAVEGAPGGP